MTKAEDPRAGYIAIAARAFSDAGYNGTSLASVARTAGVTKQALLHFFGTKEALYGAVLDDLAARLTADVEAAHDPDPAAHLTGYFITFQRNALRNPQNVRLVVHALLDSDESAQRWPLKPYLDRLSALAKQTKGARQANEAEIMAWLSQVIGMVQYLAISASTLKGMYGGNLAREVTALGPGIVAKAVQNFVGQPD